MKKYIFEDCKTCNGSGQIKTMDYNNSQTGGGNLITKECPDCDGYGYKNTGKFTIENLDLEYP
jgi:DnaJ-class molecular chaperone